MVDHDRDRPPGPRRDWREERGARGGRGRGGGGHGRGDFLSRREDPREDLRDKITENPYRDYSEKDHDIQVSFTPHQQSPPNQHTAPPPHHYPPEKSEKEKLPLRPALVSSHRPHLISSPKSDSSSTQSPSTPNIASPSRTSPARSQPYLSPPPSLATSNQSKDFFGLEQLAGFVAAAQMNRGGILVDSQDRARRPIIEDTDRFVIFFLTFQPDL